MTDPAVTAAAMTDPTVAAAMTSAVTSAAMAAAVAAAVAAAMTSAVTTSMATTVAAAAMTTAVTSSAMAPSAVTAFGIERGGDCCEAQQAQNQAAELQGSQKHDPPPFTSQRKVRIHAEETILATAGKWTSEHLFLLYGFRSAEG